MADGVLTALIGLAGTVAGAFISAYSEELKALMQGRLKRDRDLCGNCECRWDATLPEGGSPSKKEYPIEDMVAIEAISAERIRAIGRTRGVGEYRLDGRISRSYLVTFFYQGIGSPRQPLGGVVILELNAGRNKLTGYWYEYDEDREIVGGKTVWTKSDHDGSSTDRTRPF
jgi:hypothetical protein